MNKKNIKVSLIIPVYNVEAYLRQCLETACKQTYHSYEVVMVDDGSTDGSGYICEEFNLKYDNVVLIHQENEGLMSAWMKGLQISRGEYIAFLDGDDWVASDYIERLVNEADNGASIVCCNMRIEYEAHSTLKKEGIACGTYNWAEIQNEIYPQMLNNNSYLGRMITPHRCAKLFRRDLLEKNLKYCDQNISYGEDLNIVFPALLDCRQLSVLNDEKGLYHYRQNNSSIIRTYKKDMFTQIQKLHAKLVLINEEKCVYDFSWQIGADYLTLFLEYIKNETRNEQKGKELSKLIIDNFKLLEKEISDYSVYKIRMKKTDKILLFFLLNNFEIGINAWLYFYYLFRGKWRGRD